MLVAFGVGNGFATATNDRVLRWDKAWREHGLCELALWNTNWNVARRILGGRGGGCEG
jgi:hypothetical protein